MKKCTKCRKRKPTSEFHNHHSRADGKTSRCKDCACKIARKNYRQNKHNRGTRFRRVPYGQSVENLFPDVASWLISQPGKYDAACLSPNSEFVVNWRCPDGHNFPRSVVNQTRNKNCLICSSLAVTHPDLAAEWDTELNGALKSTDATKGSGDLVHWQCKFNHSWQANVYARVQGNGCPYCSGQKRIEGENDLATTHPEVAASYDRRSNSVPLKGLSANSHQVVNWICELGHTWPKSVAERVNAKNPCPECRSISHIHPELAKLWDHQKNDLEVRRTGPASDKTASWLCEAGHSWTDRVYTQVKRGPHCPICRGLAFLYPEHAKDWDHEKNGDVTPERTTPGSNTPRWWKCRKHGSWQATPLQKVSGQRCRKCSGRDPIKGKTDLATQFPAVDSMWHQKKNGEKRPEDYLSKSNQKVWVKCETCAYEWDVRVYSLTESLERGSNGCPHCAEHGYDASKPSYFYVVWATSALGDTKLKNVVQFGVTNDWDTRSRVHRRHKFLAQESGPLQPDGHSLFSAEQQLKGRRGILANRGLQSTHSLGLPDYPGCTESFKLRDFKAAFPKKYEKIVDEGEKGEIVSVDLKKLRSVLLRLAKSAG